MCVLCVWVCLSLVLQAKRHRGELRELLAAWRGCCAAHTHAIADALDRYHDAYMLGQTLLVRPALYTWLYFVTQESNCREFARAQGRRFARQVACAWRRAAATIAQEGLTLRRFEAWQNSRRARSAWVVWLAAREYAHALALVFAVSARRRLRRRMRAWCVRS